MEQRATEEPMTYEKQAQPADPPSYQSAAYPNSGQAQSYPIPTGQAAAYPSHAGAGPGYPHPGTYSPVQGHVVQGTQSQPYTDYTVNSDAQMLVPGQERPSFGAMMGLSCFNAWCCCLLLGIAAFIFARDGEKLFQQGLITESRQKYRVAKIINIVGICVGMCLLTTVIIVGVLEAQNNDNHYYG